MWLLANVSHFGRPACIGKAAACPVDLAHEAGAEAWEIGVAYRRISVPNPDTRFRNADGKIEEPQVRRFDDAGLHTGIRRDQEASFQSTGFDIALGNTRSATCGVIDGRCIPQLGDNGSGTIGGRVGWRSGNCLAKDGGHQGGDSD
ncbi:hypothetical protein [Paraburkholderia sp. GAS82]|uniref:hypothetical protein n=1 Tax=Paraburkholderia sp. GAS82 TaxID=3035137 RepID=UPI003D1BC094